MRGKKINNDKLMAKKTHKSRIQIFQATRTPKNTIKIIEMPWGTLSINGKLRQVHANFIETFFYNAEETIKHEDGRVEITVDPCKIGIALGGGKEYSQSTLSLHAKGNGSSNALASEGGGLWSIIFSSEFMQLMHHDLSLHYDPLPVATKIPASKNAKKGASNGCW